MLWTRFADLRCQLHTINWLATVAPKICIDGSNGRDGHGSQWQHHGCAGHQRRRYGQQIVNLPFFILCSHFFSKLSFTLLAIILFLMSWDPCLKHAIFFTTSSFEAFAIPVEVHFKNLWMMSQRQELDAYGWSFGSNLRLCIFLWSNFLLRSFVSNLFPVGFLIFKVCITFSSWTFKRIGVENPSCFSYSSSN